MNFQTAAVVINETELSEPIHKEVNSRSRGADHFCQGFLAYLGNYILRSPFFARPSLPKRANSKRVRANRFSAELNS